VVAWPIASRQKEVALLPLSATLPADIDTWVGGGAAIVTSVERSETGLGAHSYGATGQTELDFRLESGPVYFRLDLDLQLASSDPDKDALGYPDWSYLDHGVKLGPPEWAMLQYTVAERFPLRFGIMTHAIGLEDWDEWNTYFPTKSTVYSTLPGRMLGFEPAIQLESGYEIFAFGGCDLDYNGCYTLADNDGDGNKDGFTSDGIVAGAGITTLQDTWGTWSGIAAYPTIDYYVAAIAAEMYPLTELWVAVDGSAGLTRIGEYEEFHSPCETKFCGFFAGTLTANVIPEEIVHPMFRLQGMIDPHNAMGLPKFGVGGGITVSPFDEFKIMVEGRALRVESESTGELEWTPGVFTSITLKRSEPPPYSAKYEEEEAEAEASTRPQRRIEAPPAPGGPNLAIRTR
jgi:hypothetical protein